MSHLSQREAPASAPTRVTRPAPTATPIDAKRRRFLLALGAGGAGAAAVATQSLAAPAADAVAQAAPEAAQGYRETEHVRDYYATTRI
ncbi:MAG: formate dehydrogenase [Burkholderiales bacterium]